MQLPDRLIDFINMVPENEMGNDEDWRFVNETEETLKICTNKLYSENTAKNPICATIMEGLGKFCTVTTRNIDSFLLTVQNCTISVSGL